MFQNILFKKRLYVIQNNSLVILSWTAILSILYLSPYVSVQYQPLKHNIMQQLVDTLPARVYRWSHICSRSRYGSRTWAKALGALFRPLKRLNKATMKSSPALQLFADVSKQLSWQISENKWVWVSGTRQINERTFNMNLSCCWGVLERYSHKQQGTQWDDRLAHIRTYCTFSSVRRWAQNCDVLHPTKYQPYGGRLWEI